MPEKIDGNPLESLSNTAVKQASVELRHAAAAFVACQKALREVKPVVVWVLGQSQWDSGLSFAEAASDLALDVETLRAAYLALLPDGMLAVVMGRHDFLCPFIPERRCQ